LVPGLRSVEAGDDELEMHLLRVAFAGPGQNMSNEMNTKEQKGRRPALSTRAGHASAASRCPGPVFPFGVGMHKEDSCWFDEDAQGWTNSIFVATKYDQNTAVALVQALKECDIKAYTEPLFAASRRWRAIQEANGKDEAR